MQELGNVLQNVWFRSKWGFTQLKTFHCEDESTNGLSDCLLIKRLQYNKTIDNLVMLHYMQCTNVPELIISEVKADDAGCTITYIYGTLRAA